MSEPLSPTRTAAFERRLRKRYAAEKRFRAAGLGAILFSVAVLVFLLVTMTINGLGGLQRVTLQVPIDFGEVGLTAPAGMTDQAAIVRSLQDQGLIAARRGRVIVVDRAGLKRHACECYSVVEEHFGAVIGPSGSGAKGG